MKKVIKLLEDEKRRLFANIQTRNKQIKKLEIENSGDWIRWHKRKRAKESKVYYQITRAIEILKIYTD